MTISQAYDTDQADLWDVVTNPERIPRWFLPVSGDLRVGGSYQFEGNAGGTITKCERPHAVGATWEFGDQVSWVEVRLVPEGDGRTRFELEHVAHVADEHWEQYGPGAVGLGWEGAFWGLANHLDTPEATITPRRPWSGRRRPTASRSCGSAPRRGPRRTSRSAPIRSRPGARRRTR
ncbi:SRPBCC family protein [Actinoplanes sp. CA-252034]|uniref:SRPBCC family protein n=1 Tax=Actinoplanes sp. CA-252034 TaxID=3239906 RepID=UPI003D964B6D